MSQISGKKRVSNCNSQIGHELFIIHVVFLQNPGNNIKNSIHPFCKIFIVALVVNKAVISIPYKYSNFAEDFFFGNSIRTFWIYYN